MSDGSGYVLVLPFLPDDPAWAMGFEVGKLYAEMRSGREYIHGQYHRANDEQIFLMAQRLGYSCEWEPVDEDWFEATFERLGEGL